MNGMMHYTLGLMTAATLVATSAFAADLPAGAIDFGRFTPSVGGEFVEVNINQNLISLAARLAEQQEPKVAEVIRGLKQIRVNVIGLDKSNLAEMETRLKTIGEDLEAKQWDRVVAVRQQDQQVGVHVKTRGNEAVEGLVVTVLEGKRQAVLVNIVGNIKPEDVAMIGERFHIDPLKHAGKAMEKKP